MQPYRTDPLPTENSLLCGSCLLERRNNLEPKERCTGRLSHRYLGAGRAQVWVYVALSLSEMFQLFLLPQGGGFFSQIVSVTTVAYNHFARPLSSDF